MKVGKAIYNILSQSTDVQSNFPFNTTDYSPTGTELVTNGDFSATGTDVIYNGDFADTSIALGTTGSGWSLSAGLSEYTTFGSDTAVKMTKVTDTNQLRAKTNIGGNVLTSGASYKLTYKVLENNGVTSLRVYYGGSSTLSLVLDVTHTVYFTNGAANSVLQFINDTNNSDITFTDIVVKELGEGWTLEDGWSIGEDKAVADGSTSTSNLLTQDLGLVADKNYKITFNSDRVGGVLFVRDSDNNTIYTLNAGTGSATNTFYISWAGSGGTIKMYAYSYDGSLTNISIEEMVLNKIFPELAPPDIDAPYIVYSVVSNSPSETKNANGDIDTASIEVYGFQDTYNKAVDLGVSVRAALDRKTGTYNTIEIQSTNYINEQMDVNEARKLWAAIQDYSIRIKNI